MKCGDIPADVDLGLEDVSCLSHELTLNDHCWISGHAGYFVTWYGRMYPLCSVSLFTHSEENDDALACHLQHRYTHTTQT
jgi:hypothetical protein